MLPIFTDWESARRAGLYSRTEWKRRGFAVADNCEGAGFVWLPQMNSTVGRIRPENLMSFYCVVGHDGDYLLVTSAPYRVFSEDQTTAESNSRLSRSEKYIVKEKLSSFYPSNNKCPPHQRLPTTTAKGGVHQGKYKKSRKPGIQRQNEIRTYRPVGFELPTSLKAHEDQILYMVGLIHWGQVREWKRQDWYVPLKDAYLDAWSRRGYRKWRNEVRRSVFECDNHAINGVKSFGYRLREEHRGCHELVTIRDKAVVEYLHKRKLADLQSPIEKHLAAKLDMIQMDPTSFDQHFGSLHATEFVAPCVQMMADQVWNPSVCEFGRRFHATHTRLWTPAWSCASIDGEPVAVCDIRSSQPVFIGLDLMGHGIDCRAYLDLVCRGDLYDALGSDVGLRRSVAKTEFLKALYSENGFSSPVKSAFKARFPEAAKTIREMKKKGANLFCRRQQRAESKFVIHTVCRRIMYERPELPIFTVHDSIGTKASEVAYVRDKITAAFGELEAFKSLGFVPNVSTKVYDSGWRADWLADYEDRRTATHMGWELEDSLVNEEAS